MRIAHVVYSCVPGCFRGGVPKAVFELCVAQAALGHEVDILTTVLNSGELTMKRVGSFEQVSGVRIRYFGLRSRRWYSSPSLRAALAQDLLRYDVVHSHNTYLALNLYAAKVASGRRPLFFHVHGALDPVMVRKGIARRIRKEAYIRVIERSNLSAASGIFALSNNESRQLRQWGVKVPIHVVPNGVNVLPRDDDSARSFRESHAIGPAEPIVAYIGRIVPKKALEILVKAFARSHVVKLGGRLVIGGDRRQDCDYVQALDAMVHQCGIDKHVVWTGFLDEQAKRGLLSTASVFSHATRSEGMAISPLEAMAASVPTIVSDTCYMDEAVCAGAVKQVSCNVESLTEALNALFASENARSELGARGVEYVTKHHSWTEIAKRIVRQYDAAIQQHGGLRTVLPAADQPSRSKAARN